MQRAASRVGGLDAGFVPGQRGIDAKAIMSGAQSGTIKVLILLGVDDDVDMVASKNTFTIYVGSHGDWGARTADLILPSAAYTEKDATYVNTEGRVQRTLRAHYPVGDAREDWTIFRALSDVLGQTLPCNQIRLFAIFPYQASIPMRTWHTLKVLPPLF